MSHFITILITVAIYSCVVGIYHLLTVYPESPNDRLLTSLFLVFVGCLIALFTIGITNALSGH